uniref:Uncharacterized protein n=1 Tax=Mucochytrium quahogii TaxID=96639 RepID=A0A7S2REK2_9STRA|mmetsp:Transcript_12218/g.22260  ORF Transcript_12218/g.22260 Transcript_12218/m.22260 type:complete len:167 (-) Transcript_12218:107-607(-)
MFPKISRQIAPHNNLRVPVMKNTSVNKCEEKPQHSKQVVARKPKTSKVNYNPIRDKLIRKCMGRKKSTVTRAEVPVIEKIAELSIETKKTSGNRCMVRSRPVESIPSNEAWLNRLEQNLGRKSLSGCPEKQSEQRRNVLRDDIYRRLGQGETLRSISEKVASTLAC